MTLPKTSPNDISFTFLLCSLFTLLPSAFFFTRFSLKENVSHSILGRDSFLLNKADLLNLYAMLNSLVLKAFATTLLEPLIFKKKVLKSDLLFQYIRKFKHNYKYYFFSENTDYSYVPLDSEINYEAIKILYLLACL